MYNPCRSLVLVFDLFHARMVPSICSVHCVCLFRTIVISMHGINPSMFLFLGNYQSPLSSHTGWRETGSQTAMYVGPTSALTVVPALAQLLSQPTLLSGLPSWQLSVFSDALPFYSCFVLVGVCWIINGVLKHDILFEWIVLCACIFNRMTYSELMTRFTHDYFSIFML